MVKYCIYTVWKQYFSIKEIGNVFWKSRNVTSHTIYSIIHILRDPVIYCNGLTQ